MSETISFAKPIIGSTEKGQFPFVAYRFDRFGVIKINEESGKIIDQLTHIISTFFGKLVLLLEAILCFPFLANFFFGFRKIQGWRKRRHGEIVFGFVLVNILKET